MENKAFKRRRSGDQESAPEFFKFLVKSDIVFRTSFFPVQLIVEGDGETKGG